MGIAKEKEVLNGMSGLFAVGLFCFNKKPFYGILPFNEICLR
jgi:hypothetical protein